MKGTGKGQAEEIRGLKNTYFQTPFKHVFLKKTRTEKILSFMQLLAANLSITDIHFRNGYLLVICANIHNL